MGDYIEEIWGRKIGVNKGAVNRGLQNKKEITGVTLRVTN